MNRTRKAQRGSATVELAITMLLLIPIFLYALFLDDLLRYRLNQQEAVVSSSWDFTPQNYDQPLQKYQPARDPGGATTVQRNARLMYCDHESGIEHYDATDSTTGEMSDCSSTEHHKGTAVVAHECWLNANAKQITCDNPDLSVGSVSDGLWKKVQSGQHANGGMFSCTANLVVENYLLPRTFLQEFAKDNNLSKAKWDNEGNAHQNAEDGTSSTAYFFEPDTFAVVADSWAYAGTQDIKAGTKSGGGTGALWDDTNTVFTKNLLYTPYQAAAAIFGTQLVTEGLFSPAFAGPTFRGLDDPTSPNVAITPSKAPSTTVNQDTGGKSYFSSPWKDFSQDAYENTYNARGDHYLGCQSAQSC